MKIIALLPVKNEAWILPFSLTNLSLIADEIIVLDDSSSDESVTIAKNFIKVTLLNFEASEKFTNMSIRRNTLLAEGRKRGGTHFICLDADEVFSTPFLNNYLTSIKELQQGHALTLPWIQLSYNNKQFTYNSSDKTSYKDVVFCDEPSLTYPNIALSEPRTPVHKNKTITLPFSSGAILHFQQVATERQRLKTVWYRMNEFIEGKRAAIRINATYTDSKIINAPKNTILTDSFVEKNISLVNINPTAGLQRDRIQSLLTQHGTLYFEPLDIWHIPELRDQFINKIGREPKPSVAPKWLLFLNDIKNKIKNNLNI